MEEELLVPPEQEAGAFATTAFVWHTQYEFTIDFAVSRVDELDASPEPRFLVVARVRIPPAFAFELMRMLSAKMESYENEWGEIQRPERRNRGLE